MSDEHGFSKPTRGSGTRVVPTAGGRRSISFVQACSGARRKRFRRLIEQGIPWLSSTWGSLGPGALLQLGAIKEFPPRYAPARSPCGSLSRGMIDLADLARRNEASAVDAPPGPRLQPASADTSGRDPGGALRRFASDTETAERAAREDVKRSSLGDEALAIAKPWNLSRVAGRYARGRRCASRRLSTGIARSDR